MNIIEFNSNIIISSNDCLLKTANNLEICESIKIPAPKLPPNLTKGQLQVLNKEDRTINSLATSHDHKQIAVATENKQVVIYDESFNVVQNFVINRAASKILFTKCGDVVVADRTGDVYLYKRNVEECELLLGHLSMILDMLLSECENYIITCDRDEKIRVSHFPNTYNIVSFCLGHKEFVTSLKLVQNILISASGDGSIRFWDYLKGTQLNFIDTNKFVENNVLLEEFSNKMDKEKVDITALPVTDLQIIEKDDSIIFAVSLYNFDRLQIYKMNIKNLQWTFLHFVQPVDVIHKFFLKDYKLYIFDNVKLTIYNLINEEFCEENNDTHSYNSYKDKLRINDCNSIIVLYKRTFDNVQEYLERKKLRLESVK